MRNVLGRRVWIAVITIAAFLPVNGAYGDDAVPWKQLSAQWWQWALSIPTSVNPLIDPTGGNGMVGQRGTTWFLAGAFRLVALSRANATCHRARRCSSRLSIRSTSTRLASVNRMIRCRSASTVISSEQFVNGATNLSYALDGDPVRPLH